MAALLPESGAAPQMAAALLPESEAVPSWAALLPEPEAVLYPGIIPAFLFPAKIPLLNLFPVSLLPEPFPAPASPKSLPAWNTPIPAPAEEFLLQNVPPDLQFPGNILPVPPLPEKLLPEDSVLPSQILLHSADNVLPAVPGATPLHSVWE